MNKGDVYIARFPLGGKGGIKVRPVLLLTGPVGPVPEVLAAYLSSVVPQPLLPSDLVIDPTSPEYASTNLKAISVVRLHKLASLHRREVIRPVGKLSASALLEIDQRLRVILQL